MSRNKNPVKKRENASGAIRGGGDRMKTMHLPLASIAIAMTPIAAREELKRRFPSHGSLRDRTRMTIRVVNTKKNKYPSRSPSNIGKLPLESRVEEPAHS